MVARPNVERKVAQELNMKGHLSLSEAAEKLGVSSEAARQLVFRGTLVHVRKNRRNWVPQSAVRKLLRDKDWQRLHSRRVGRA